MENLCDHLSVTDIMEALCLLLTPSGSGQKCGDPDRDLFVQHLQQQLDGLDRKLCDKQFHSLSSTLKERVMKTDVPDTSAQWQYVNYILQLLYLLTQVLLKQETNDSSTEPAEVECSRPKCQQDTPHLANAVLSLSHLSIVKNALQFITSLGICPNLAPGVGIPLQHRSKLLTVAPLDAATVADINEVSESNRARLSVSVFVLTEMLKVDELKSVILNMHLNDILAALLQLLYGYSRTGKIAFKQKESHSEEACVDAVDHSSKKRNEEMKERCTRHLTSSTDCEEILEYIMANVNPVLLIRELMVLQAGVPKQIQSTRSPGCTVLVPPGWLKKSCSHLLIRLANRPQGIRNLYEAVSAGSDPGCPVEWKHCGAVARIIAGYPVQDKFLDQYVGNISKQLMDLLHTGGKGAMKLTQLLGTVACAVTVKHKAAFFLHFHQPLLQPLLCCLESPGQKVDGTVAVSEEALTECLRNMHQVYIIGQQPLSDILCALQPVIPVLWVLYCVTHSAVYSIKQYVRDLVVSYLKSLGGTEAAACLHQLCQGPGSSEMSVVVHFTAGNQGGLQAVYGDARGELGEGEKQRVAAVVSVLQDLKTDSVAAELLVTLLKEMTDMISTETQQSGIVLPPRMLWSEVRQEKQRELMRRVTLLHLLASICETFGSECLRDNTHILLFVKASLERGVAVCCGTNDEEMALFETETMSMALGLLTAVMAGAVKMQEEDRVLMDSMLPLLEVIGQGHTDEFIREMASDIRIAIATRGAVWSSLHRSDKGEKESNPEKNTSLLQPKKKAAGADSRQRVSSLLLTETSCSEEPEHFMQTGLPSRPLIEVLSDHPCPDPETAKKKTIKTISSAVPVVEVTAGEDRSVSGTTLLKANVLSSPQTDAVTESTAVASLTHPDQTVSYEGSASRIGTGVADLPLKSVQHGSVFKPREETGKVKCSPLQTVFEELCDPLIPVRGHALISLSRLVQEREPETLAQKDVVQRVFEENLHHGDSYLYLAAIGGLSALADCFPESILPSLASEFAGFCRHESRLTAEHRLKLGEALMKATRNLGEMIPKYREILLGAVLTGARDKDATVRASSISNLAEVCALLRFSLGPVLQEVLHCCSTLLETDEAIVRQAAAMTLARLLEGLGSDCFSVLESVLPSMYRLLKKVCAMDEDDAVRMHANLALDHLDTVTRDFAFPKQTLQKKIQVLPNADTFS